MTNRTFWSLWFALIFVGCIIALSGCTISPAFRYDNVGGHPSIEYGVRAAYDAR